LKRSWWGALALAAGIVILMVGCGENAPKNNDTPIITNLFPSNITAGSDGFTLAVTGTGLIASARGVTFAYWNGSPRSTTYNLTTNQLQVTIPASDLATPGSPQITLWNPPPGGGLTVTAATFTIVAASNNGPVITQITPPSAKAGGADFMVTVDGTNFAPGDVITWNGVPLATSISGDTATATIPAADIVSVGTGSIAMSTPGLVVASPAVAFPITGANNPSPSVKSLTPSTVTAGGASDVEVVLSGSGFTASSTAEWTSGPPALPLTGVPIATSFLSGSQLVLLIPTNYTTAAGSAQITVTNPAPGGGTSSQVTLTIAAAAQ